MQPNPAPRPPAPPIPGARHALTAFRPAAPVLRVRYRVGVPVDGHGFPMWRPYARAVVALPPVPPGRGVDEMRVLDVLVGNALLGIPDLGTPHGWVWAHAAGARSSMLVPADLHASFAHLGGVSTMPADRSVRGIPFAADPVDRRSEAALTEPALAPAEAALGYRLPASYRAFLLATNGARPSVPAVHPAHGFVADQYLFGLGREDWMEDLVYANGWFGDRLTPDFLAAGHVQGGTIAVKVRGDDRGSVWYLDDDDPRDADTFDAADRTALLHRVGDDFDGFWSALRAVPYWLRRLAVDVAGSAALVEAEGAGDALPRGSREPARDAPGLVAG